MIEHPPANVLLVDDRPENLVALQAVLDPLGQNLVCAESGEAALRALLQHEFAVILLDVQMPGLDGYETARLIKARARTAHVPIIFLTADGSDAGAPLRGYGAGAVDYLVKPFNPVVLRSKVSIFIDLHRLRHEAQEAAHRALHDPLTGLPNRVLFSDRLAQSLRRHRRVPSSLAVLYLDLDGFKPVNDRMGHEHGDALLVAVAQRLQQTLRPGDTVARLGGDEFAVLADPVESSQQVELLAERIVHRIAEPFELAAGTALVSASVGIVVTQGPADPVVLMRHADQAMYHAKAIGGGAWQVFAPDGGGALAA